MTVVVTGATGFIGHALVSRLIAEQRGTVRAVVRSETRPLPPGVNRIVVGDLAGNPDYGAAVRGVDAVVHLAARAHVLSERASSGIELFPLVNVHAVVTLAQAAASAGVRRFLFISSVGVNGNRTSGTPFTETDPPNPQEAYAVSKWHAEEALRRVARDTGMEVVIVRPPLVYGFNAPGNFGRLVRLIRAQIPLPLGAVRNRRSFIGLDNLVDFILTCLHEPSAANQTFLVSDDHDLATPDLVRRLAAAMHRRTRLIPVPPRVLWALAAASGKRAVAERLLGSLQVDITKARRVLNWSPLFSVDEGLRRVCLQSTADAP